MKPWQPNTAQWRVIWIITVMLILAWPPAHGSSLAVKAANWLVDPANALPPPPAPLPMGLDDNGDAVSVHDALEQAYYSAYANSGIMRLRLKLKTAMDPFEPSTERQILSGIGILGALAVWRLNRR